jgi:hypothetical protein
LRPPFFFIAASSLFTRRDLLIRQDRRLLNLDNLHHDIDGRGVPESPIVNFIL